MLPPEITLILARSENNVIGHAGGLPWPLPEDLQHFKNTTLGRAIIMGRKTFESIGKALPGRRSIVITRNPSWSAPNAERADSLKTALALAYQPTSIQIETDRVFIIGGAEIFEEAVGIAHSAIVTEIDAVVEGDVYFHGVDVPAWALNADSGPLKSTNGLSYRIREWVRVRDSER